MIIRRIKKSIESQTFSFGAEINVTDIRTSAKELLFVIANAIGMGAALATPITEQDFIQFLEKRYAIFGKHCTNIARWGIDCAIRERILVRSQLTPDNLYFTRTLSAKRGRPKKDPDDKR